MNWLGNGSLIMGLCCTPHKRRLSSLHFIGLFLIIAFLFSLSLFHTLSHSLSRSVRICKAGDGGWQFSSRCILFHGWFSLLFSQYAQEHTGQKRKRWWVYESVCLSMKTFKPYIICWALIDSANMLICWTFTFTSGTKRKGYYYLCYLSHPCTGVGNMKCHS